MPSTDAHICCVFGEFFRNFKDNALMICEYEKRLDVSFRQSVQRRFRRKGMEKGSRAQPAKLHRKALCNLKSAEIALELLNP